MRAHRRCYDGSHESVRDCTARWRGTRGNPRRFGAAMLVCSLLSGWELLGLMLLEWWWDARVFISCAAPWPVVAWPTCSVVGAGALVDLDDVDRMGFGPESVENADAPNAVRECRFLDGEPFRAGGHGRLAQGVKRGPDAGCIIRCDALQEVACLICLEEFDDGHGGTRLTGRRRDA